MSGIYSKVQQVVVEGINDEGSLRALAEKVVIIFERYSELSEFWQKTKPEGKSAPKKQKRCANP